MHLSICLRRRKTLKKKRERKKEEQLRKRKSELVEMDKFCEEENKNECDYYAAIGSSKNSFKLKSFL